MKSSFFCGFLSGSSSLQINAVIYFNFTLISTSCLALHKCILVSLTAHLDKEHVCLRDSFAYLVILPKGKAMFGFECQNLYF